MRNRNDRPDRGEKPYPTMDKKQTNDRKKQIRLELKKDFLDRDKGFIHQTKAGRTEWEKEMKSADGTVSGLLTDTSSVNAVLRNAWKTASSMVDAMGVPGGVEIHMDDTRSYTDCRHLIVLATDCFDDKNLTPGQALDCFTGEAVHEAAHILYTKPTGSAQYGEFVRDMENIIEDERIERCVGEDFPGFANFIRATKYRAFDQANIGEAMSQVEEENYVARIINAVLKLVRYPDAFDDRDIDDFGEELLQVKEVLTPYPESTADCCKKALEIRELFREWLKKAAEKRQQQQQQQQNAPGGNSGDDRNEENDEKPADGQSGNGNEGNQCGESPEERDEENGNGADGQENGPQEDDGVKENDARTPASDDRESDGKEEQDSGEDEPSPETDGGKEMTDEDIDKMLDTIAGRTLRIAMSAPAKENAPVDEKDQCLAVKQNACGIDAVMQGAAEGAGAPGNESFVIVYPEIFDRQDRDKARERYRASYNRIRAYIPATKKILALSGTEYKHQVTGRLSGKLDAGKLAEAVQGVPSVYRRTISAKTNKTAVCVLIDESGSMYGKKVTAALDAAVLLAESVGKLHNVDFFCYGFTTDLIKVYAEHGHRPSDTLGYLDSTSGTPTGNAIDEAVCRIRRQTDEECLLFVVTDGDPDSRAKVKKALKEAIGKNFSPVGIGIDGSTAGQFPESADVPDVSELPLALGKIVRGGLLKRSRRTFLEG